MADIAHLIRRWPQGRFRGVAFHVESASSEVKQRLVQHKAPGVDGALLEGLGLEPEIFTIEAYVGNDAWSRADGKRDAMLAAMRAKTVGQLYHPSLDRNIRVKLEQVTVREDGSQLGYIALTLRFIEAKARPAMITGPLRKLSAQRRAEDLPATVKQSLTADASPALSVAGLPDYAREGVAGVLIDAAGWAQESLSSAWLDKAQVAVINRDSQDLAQGAEQAASDPPQALAQLDRLLARVAGAIKHPKDGERAFLPLVAALSWVGGGSIQQQRADRAVQAWQACLASLAFAYAAGAMIEQDFGARDIAMQAADRLSEAVRPLIDYWFDRGALELARELEALRLAAAEDLRQRAETLRPVLPVTSPGPVPVTALAWRLYGRLDERGDLIARNRLLNPMAVTGRLEALAPEIEGAIHVRNGV